MALLEGGLRLRTRGVARDTRLYADALTDCATSAFNYMIGQRIALSTAVELRRGVK